MLAALNQDDIQADVGDRRCSSQSRDAPADYDDIAVSASHFPLRIFWLGSPSSSAPPHRRKYSHSSQFS
jgi:hypothetical protein